MTDECSTCGYTVERFNEVEAATAARRHAERVHPMSDLSSFREQAEAVVAEHGESEGTVNKRAFCAHEECSMYCPCDAYTQATRVIELVKMVEGEIGGWAAREMLREEIDSLKAEREQALAALAEANERIAELEQKPRPHVVAQLFPAKKVVGRGGICKNCGTAVYWSSDKPKWVHTNGRAPCHPGWKMRAEVDND
jgi:hypothetical protein